MARDEEIDEQTGRGRGLFAPIVSAVSFLTGTIKIFIEEVSMGFPAFSIIKMLAGIIDPNMAVWVVVIMTAGYWLKRASRPMWLPSLPVLLLALFLAVGFAFGWMQNVYDGWKGVAYVLAYGIGNGIFFTGLSFVIYDIGHGTIKKSKAKKAAKEAENG